MNYSEPLINQVIVFFRSIGAGIILGILYDCISVLRMIFGERKSVWVFFDTVFFILAAFISFFFMVLYNSGQVRFNLMVGELAGAVALHMSIGVYLLKAAEKYISIIRKIFSALFYPFRRLYEKSAEFLKMKIHLRKTTVKEKKEKTKEKISLLGKIHLKNKNKSV